MTIIRLRSSALGALMMLIMSTPAPASNPQTDRPAAESKKREPAVPVDDVPAPPMSLLFAIGAVGLIWGRRLAATARKKQESARSE